jgi:predicted ATPase
MLDSHGSREAYARIEGEMRELLPDLEELRIVSTGPNWFGIGFQHRGHDGCLSSADVSDGTLYTLGMLAIVNQPSPPALLMIEEPETGLHPGRLRWLIDQLADLAQPLDDRPPVQVLISTHSPYVLDQFAEMPEAVRVVERIEGRSRVTPLVEILERLGIGRDDLREVSLGRRWYAKLFEEA